MPYLIKHIKLTVQTYDVISHRGLCDAGCLPVPRCLARQNMVAKAPGGNVISMRNIEKVRQDVG